MLLASLVFLIVIGSVSGFLTGFFGTGGSIILVPSLMFFFDSHELGSVAAHMAVGTSLALMIPNAIISLKKEKSLGNYDGYFIQQFRKWIVCGMFTGGFLMLFLSDLIISILFFIGLILSIVLMATGKNIEISHSQKNNCLRFGNAIIAMLSVLMGVGGGTLTAPFYHKVIGVPLKKTIAISNNFTIYIAIRGTLVAVIAGLLANLHSFPYSLGYVNLVVFAIIAPTSCFFAPLGVIISNKTPITAHKWLFVILMIICLSMIIIKWILGTHFYPF